MDLLNFETYIPTERQLEAHERSEMFKCYGGAMGGGKSVWLCAEGIQLSLDFPGNVGYLCRKTYTDFKKTTLPILLEMIPPKIIKNYNKTDGEIDLVNGSKIILGHLEDLNKLKSLNLGWYGIDEATDTTEEFFLMLNTRLRRKVPGIKYHGLLATNPEPGWVKDRFVDPQAQGNPLRNHIFVPALPKDNPHLPDSYLEAFDHMPPLWRAKYREGSWDVFDSQIFKPDWIIPSSDIPEIAAKFTAVDPAISEKDEADDSVICTMGIDYNGVIHELETISGKWSFDELLNNCVAAYSRHKPSFFGVEYVAFQKALGDVLNKLGVPVTELKDDTDKVRRAISVTHFFEQNIVRINEQKTQKQLLEFPKGQHDDIVDSVVYCLKLIKDFASDKYIKKEDKYKHLKGVSRQFWQDHFDHQESSMEDESNEI